MQLKNIIKKTKPMAVPVKKVATILYPNLLASPPESYAQEQAGRQGTSAGQLSWQNFPLLAKLQDSLNSIWGRLELNNQGEHNDFAFYGCSEGVGTTFLSFHMALYVALSHGLKTVYVDTVREPSSSSPFPINVPNGLFSYYFNGASVDDCIYQTKVENLYVLPSEKRSMPDIKNQLTPQTKVKELIAALRQQFDVAIFDCQSVLLSPIEITYARNIKNNLLVAQYAMSRREVCNQVIETFKANKLNIAGVILNQREYPIPIEVYNLLK